MAQNWESHEYEGRREREREGREKGGAWTESSNPTRYKFATGKILRDTHAFWRYLIQKKKTQDVYGGYMDMNNGVRDKSPRTR